MYRVNFIKNKNSCVPDSTASISLRGSLGHILTGAVSAEQVYRIVLVEDDTRNVLKLGPNKVPKMAAVFWCLLKTTAFIFIPCNSSAEVLWAWTTAASQTDG